MVILQILIELVDIKKCRQVDFYRKKFDMEANVERIEYDPNRSCYIMLVKFIDGSHAYYLAPQKIKAGDKIENGSKINNDGFKLVYSVTDPDNAVNYSQEYKRYVYLTSESINEAIINEDVTQANKYTWEVDTLEKGTDYTIQIDLKYDILDGNGLTNISNNKYLFKTKSNFVAILNDERRYVTI